MKYSLTITDASPSELAKVLAMLGAGAPVTVATTVNTNANADDDESGDADAAPGTVDNTGLPWDDRIHSTPAKLTAKKVWRRRKGVSDELVAAVEAELRARATAPAPMPAAPAPMMQPGYQPPPPEAQMQVAPPVYQPQPAPAPTYAPPPQSFDAAAQPVYQPQPAPAPVPAPVPQPQAAAAPLDFNGFMMHIQTLLPTGKVDAGYLANLSQRLGIGAITDLSARPDLIGQAVHTMQTEQRW